MYAKMICQFHSKTFIVRPVWGKKLLRNRNIIYRTSHNDELGLYRRKENKFFLSIVQIKLWLLIFRGNNYGKDV